jgi:Adenylate and Guanylate cyclase catalytic domain
MRNVTPAISDAPESRSPRLTSRNRWGHDIGFGIGIAHGFATLGTIGFEGRFDYAAIGTVSNVASRLCDEAKPGQILISPRVLTKVENAVEVEPVGEFALKGISSGGIQCTRRRFSVSLSSVLVKTSRKIQAQPCNSMVLGLPVRLDYWRAAVSARCLLGRFSYGSAP